MFRLTKNKHSKAHREHATVSSVANLCAWMAQVSLTASRVLGCTQASALTTAQDGPSPDRATDGIAVGGSKCGVLGA